MRSCVATLFIGKNAAQQINGREGETATLLSTGLFNSELRVIGFAPRHLNRCALSFALAFREFGKINF